MLVSLLSHRQTFFSQVFFSLAELFTACLLRENRVTDDYQLAGSADRPSLDFQVRKTLWIISFKATIVNEPIEHNNYCSR